MQKASAILTIKNRRDFLAAARGKKWVAGTLVLQVCRRPADHPVKKIPRIGYTVSKKVDKRATIRNLAKRRLREATRKIAPAHMKEGHDYVIISRHSASFCDFSTLLRDMEFAFSRIHANKRPSSQ